MLWNATAIFLLVLSFITSTSSISRAEGAGKGTITFQATVPKQCVLTVLLRGHLAGDKGYLSTQLSSSNSGGTPIKIELKCNSRGIVAITPPVLLETIYAGNKRSTKAWVTNPSNGNVVQSDGTGFLSVSGDGIPRNLDIDMDVTYDKNSVIPAGFQNYVSTVTVTP